MLLLTNVNYVSGTLKIITRFVKPYWKLFIKTEIKVFAYFHVKSL
jgi:hypothetical protein